MNREKMVRDLIDWIENNLKSQLSLNHVAKKSGYSKWYLQRMFKAVTGRSLGEYIRARRLSRCAVELRLTSGTVLDIAMQYHFDSQQTFTRSFKKQFSITPGKYRQSADWIMSGMIPPLREDNFIPPVGSFVTLPDIILTGITHSYNCLIDDVSDKRQEMSFNYWHIFLSHYYSEYPELIYGLHDPVPVRGKAGSQQIRYTTAINTQKDNHLISDPSIILIQGGSYVKFCYQGPQTGLQSFFSVIYDTCLPSLNIKRRPGMDIECFHLENEHRKIKKTSWIHCDYLIPVDLDVSNSSLR
ncbi:TPA: helix-turn-helix domain-containing protein [Citrobacter koseri]|uniref:helix-turn-helix domain-containing protein n=1 Tax=Citrobacter koseri TaxID=545 RepID=UPI001A349518|nr:helix-turn-helix domain-containing protein [Citrobacter koseri]HDQ2604854.1 helix-turn-helix domain-containing protein [Citrobacter koseri]